MKIIVLCGKGEKGKTTTLNLVYECLIKKSETSIIQRNYINGASYHDFEAILFCKTDTHKVVAIYSAGDAKDPVQSTIKKYLNLKVDVLIVANNTDEFDFEKDIKCDDCSVCYIERTESKNNKEIEPYQAIANYKDCATICSLI